MIFRQMFDQQSSTYTYLLAGEKEALIIDPVLDRVGRYLQLLGELDLKLAKAIDTHVHADHITGLGALRDRTKCVTVMGKESKTDVVSMRVSDGDRIEIDGVRLTALYTPGHTDDSYCYRWESAVFTGDTLLIRGTGRTDFQNGDPRAAYASIFDKLLTLPDGTLVYPAHDYKGDTVSTIGEERRFNPRLQVRSVDEYVAIMSGLKLDNPKMMDVAVPANLKIGMAQSELDRKGLSLTCPEAIELIGDSRTILVDLRDKSERAAHGFIPGSVHAPYSRLEENVQPGGMLNELARSTDKRLAFYCAYGERSAMAVQAAQAAGITNVCHIKGGLDAWMRDKGPIER